MYVLSLFTSALVVTLTFLLILLLLLFPAAGAEQGREEKHEAAITGGEVGEAHFTPFPQAGNSGRPLLSIRGTPYISYGECSAWW